jgi:hypothetical protein
MENWLSKLDAGATGLAGHLTADGRQHLVVATPNGLIRSLEIGPPDWQWRWTDPLMAYHEGIVGLAAYYHPGDNRQHVFAALRAGDIWEALFIPGQQRSENWLGKLEVGAIGLAGYVTADDRQHLVVASPDGLIRALEIGPPDWQWRWTDPLMAYHEGIVGLAAYYHPGDNQQHIFAALRTGDIWEALFAPGQQPTENWLGKLEFGAIGLAGYVTADASQHLIVASTDGLMRAFEIGWPDWQWRWTDPLMGYHDGPVGLAAYYHPDNGQHVFAALLTGDIWEAITQPPPRRFTRDILPLFTQYDIKCMAEHDYDLTSYDWVASSVDDIILQVKAGTMPFRFDENNNPDLVTLRWQPWKVAILEDWKATGLLE